MNINRRGLFLAISVAAAACSSAAHAQSLQPVTGVLETLISILTGPIASMLAILAVIGCGFLAWSGRLTWGIAGSVILGIVLVFGSTQIVTFFQGALGH
ncbi:TrbC/VirB2 family protein [Phyllobacterium sp. 0TCS1.6C]|uniref:TrbC/VirB2 family protein n=1 Tax=unclassified Phyllobacterium TaxID=2638441 RepID=UPI00226484DE|nr:MULTISPECIES: TrbC/VirB2 family protein [unclassified Phyllobacterium]MCX8282150.1 TrbC/VirB2 family protein [Phyllobacterium sp. 0TCS1.6C]MCX8296358.1 TrbC/VirB2 family protein [Phyllobacterium sp. 0TCS1.6A]